MARSIPRGWRLRARARRLAREVSEFLVPSVCGGCVQVVPALSSSGLCSHCESTVPWRSQAHVGWALWSDARFSRPPSGESRPPPPACVLATWYESPVTDWIHALKYGGRRSAAVALAGLVHRALGPTTRRELDVLVAVPAHPWKRWLRGVDHAGELARRLSERTELPRIAPLRRVRATPTLGSLRRLEQRESAVRGAFRSRPLPCPGQLRIGLVDDVLTTGATARAAAAELVRAGAGEVTLVAVASNAPEPRPMACGSDADQEPSPALRNSSLSNRRSRTN